MIPYGRPPARGGIDLGARRGLSVGDLARATPPGMLSPPPKQPQEQIGELAQSVATNDAEAMALADVLGADAFRPTEAPGALTGIARVVELLTQHRGNLRERQDAEADEIRGEKTEAARRRAVTEAVQGFAGGGDVNALVSALAKAAPDEGLDLASAIARRPPSAADERWSEPYQLDGAWVRRNLQTNEVQQVVGRRPAGGASGGPYPDDGYDYE